MRPRSLAAFVAASLLALSASAGSAQQPQPRADSLDYVLTLFGQYLDSLRQQAGIPGLSAAIAGNGRIIWEAGYGFADVDAAVRATPDTPYLIGDLTQPVAASLVLRCSELGVDLDGPMGRFAGGLPVPAATIRQVLSHTSDAPPGETFQYDPSRFATLTATTESCFGTPFRKRLATAVLDRLSMSDSVPGTDLASRTAVPEGMFSDGTHARYEAVLRRRAKTYRTRQGRPSPTSIAPAGITAAGGLVSTVRDLARFSAGLEDSVLVGKDTLAVAWRNVTTARGQPLPTGLGWFVQSYNGTRLVWHFGKVSDGASSLLLQVPDRDLTLILLANSDGLSEGFGLEHGDVTTSLFAKLFLRLFV